MLKCVSGLTGRSSFMLALVTFSYGPLCDFFAQKNIADSMFAFSVPGLGQLLPPLSPVSFKKGSTFRKPDLGGHYA